MSEEDGVLEVGKIPEPIEADESIPEEPVVDEGEEQVL